MSTSLIITIKQKAGDKPVILKEATSKTAGEIEATRIYQETCADQVALIEVDTEAITPEERFNIVYKIERNCKHRGGIQRVFKFELGASQEVCNDCGMTFGDALLVEQVA